MSDARVDDLLHDLATALSIEPSPQMVARVRTRVYAGSPLRSPLGSWTVGAALAILTVAVAFGVAPDRDAVREPIVQTEARRTELSRQVSEPPSLSPVQQSAPDRPLSAIARPRTSVPETPAVAEPVAEALVPPDQAIALRRILLAMQSGRSPVPRAMAEAVDDEGRLPAPEAIGIPAITIQPITPPADGGRNKDR
jgi:hypothetical protein